MRPKALEWLSEQVKPRIATMIDIGYIESLTGLHQQNAYQIPTCLDKPMQFLHNNLRGLIMQLAIYAM